MKQTKIINSLLNEREKSLANLEKKIIEVKSEIKVLKVALSRLNSPSSQKEKRTKPSSRGRKLDLKWKKVLQFIGHQEGVSASDIMEYIKKSDFPITISNLRVQLNSYTQKDWVRRTQDSAYVLTSSGAERCGYHKKFEPSVADTTKGPNIQQDSNLENRIAHLLDHSLGTHDKKRLYN